MNSISAILQQTSDGFLIVAMHFRIPDVEDLLPAYYYTFNMRYKSRQCRNLYRGIHKHFVAMFIAVTLCVGGYHYYHNIYLPTIINNSVVDEAVCNQRGDAIEVGFHHFKIPEPSPIKFGDNAIDEIQLIKEQVATLYKWRESLIKRITKLQLEQDIKISNAIEDSLEIYEADRLGVMDYAAFYAGGLIKGISKDTEPLPTHRPLSLFKILNVNIYSSPEEIIRPYILPGRCFAFKGTTGTVRIKLGKPISIGRVTLSHASRLLLGMQGMTSAPREFEVHGYTGRDGDPGNSLGKFTYDWLGKPHQTFNVKKTFSNNQIFEEVELAILSNYGKEEFTCVYRFRVHKSDDNENGTSSRDASSQTIPEREKKKSKRCC
ncbi:SUN domain-containing protein 3-like isoform X2 [Euwallacea fornicatus]|uniref:SUN domain-containing protein 3-like isoform X2 n=1 Tax=Euwallacea fornicatus TaxID=995702 RepID=UPI00338DDEEE